MKKKFIIALSILCMAGAGCKKGLDLKPTDLVTEEAAFNNVASLQKGLNTAYGRYAAGRVNTSYANSITSDETKFGPDNGGTGQFGYRLQYTSDRSNWHKNRRLYLPVIRGYDTSPRLRCLVGVG